MLDNINVNIQVAAKRLFGFFHRFFDFMKGFQLPRNFYVRYAVMVLRYEYYV